MLRKVNAVISLISTILLLVHAIFYSVWMLLRAGIAKMSAYPSQILVVLMLTHAIISIVLAVLGHKGAEKRKCNDYPKMNKQTYVQRITGILLILFIGLHIAGALNHFQPQILHAIVHPLFFIIALAHVAVSTNKAFITLGIGNAKCIKMIDIVIKIICVFTIIACIIGFYLCLFVGVVK